MLIEPKHFAGQTKAQFEIIEYWHGLCRRANSLPKRMEVDPGVLRSHLSAISIVEIDSASHVRFRLAGSQVRSVFGQEMRGRSLHEFAGPVADMWLLGIDAVCKKMGPVGGIIEREADRHAWLRLPLAHDRGSALILCHDMIMGKTQEPWPEDKEHTIQSDRARILAA